jgi:hypothetical protein
MRVAKSQACSELQACYQARTRSRHPRKLARCLAVDMGLPCRSYFELANILINQTDLSRRHGLGIGRPGWRAIPHLLTWIIVPSRCWSSVS